MNTPFKADEALGYYLLIMLREQCHGAVIERGGRAVRMLREAASLPDGPGNREKISKALQYLREKNYITQMRSYGRTYEIRLLIPQSELDEIMRHREEIISTVEKRMMIIRKHAEFPLDKMAGMVENGFAVICKKALAARRTGNRLFSIDPRTILKEEGFAPDKIDIILRYLACLRLVYEAAGSWIVRTDKRVKPKGLAKVHEKFF